MYICLCVYEDDFVQIFRIGGYLSCLFCTPPSFVAVLSSLNQVPINSGALCKYLFRTLLKTLIKRRLSSYRSSNEPRLFSISNRLVVWRDDNPDFVFAHELNRAPQLFIRSLIYVILYATLQHVAERWKRKIF